MSTVDAAITNVVRALHHPCPKRRGYAFRTGIQRQRSLPSRINQSASFNKRPAIASQWTALTTHSRTRFLRTRVQALWEVVDKLLSREAFGGFRMSLFWVRSGQSPISRYYLATVSIYSVTCWSPERYAVASCAACKSATFTPIE